MTSRGRRLAAVLSVAAVALAACGEAVPTPVLTGAAAGVRCAKGSIAAQGSSAQANAINAWIKTFQAACPDATVEYRSTGSGAGIRAFIAGDGDFAGSDAELSAADQPKADARCASGPAIHLPMVVGPIALAYTVAGVDDLRLSPATVARIFSGEVTTWNDPAIVRENPGAALPPTPIHTVHRSDGSGTTDSFTKFLAAAGDWSFGSGTTWTAPGGTAEKGSGGVAAAVAQTDGSIGYVEWSYAEALNLRTARIGNRSGAYVALSTDAAAQAVADAELPATGDDLRLRIAYTSPKSGVYPIVLVTYEIVCAKGTSAATLDLVKAFLTYAASAEGQKAATRLGYSPLPDRIRTRVTAAVEALA